MSQSSQEGNGLDDGASGVIAPADGGLKPVAKERGRAARGGGQTPQQRQQKSRAAAAVRARSGAPAAGGGAAGGRAHGDVAVASPVELSASVVAGAVASLAEDTPADMSLAAVYSSPAHKLWKDKDTCRMIIAACSEPLRKFLEKLGTQPDRLESECSSTSNPQRPDDQFFTALEAQFNDPQFQATLPWSDAHLSSKKNERRREKQVPYDQSDAVFRDDGEERVSRKQDVMGEVLELLRKNEEGGDRRGLQALVSEQTAIFLKLS